MSEYAEIFAKYPEGDKSYLIEILRDIQDRDRYISREVMEELANHFGILDTDVEGVVSFYSLLTNKPMGKYVIRICRTACCKIKGADSLKEALEKELGVSEGEVSEDGLFSFETTECIGMCDVAPAMLVNHEPYGNLTVEKLSEILQEYRQKC